MGVDGLLPAQQERFLLSQGGGKNWRHWLAGEEGPLSRVYREEAVAPKRRRHSHGEYAEGCGNCDTEGRIAHGLTQPQWQLDGGLRWNEAEYCHMEGRLSRLEQSRWER